MSLFMGVAWGRMRWPLPGPLKPNRGPRWELGLGLAGARVPDHRGSDEHGHYTCPSLVWSTWATCYRAVGVAVSWVVAQPSEMADGDGGAISRATSRESVTVRTR